MNLSERVKTCFPVWQEQAKEGNGIAKYNLAMCYIDSEGVERDDNKAYDLLSEACELLEPQADTDEDKRTVLGYAYFNRAMLSVYFGDIVSSVKELRKAIEYGYQRAYMYLALSSGGMNTIDAQLLESTKEHYSAGHKTIEGICYSSGVRGYQQDEQRGLALLREAAEMGEPIAADVLLQHMTQLYLTTGQGDIEEMLQIAPHASNEWFAFVSVLAFPSLVQTGSEENINRAMNLLYFSVNEIGATTAAAGLLGVLGTMQESGAEIETEMLQRCADILLASPDVLKESANAVGARFLASCYEKGELGLEQDIKKALLVYQYALAGFEQQLNFFKTPQGKLYLSHLTFSYRRATVKTIKIARKRTEKKIQQLQKQIQA